MPSDNDVVGAVFLLKPPTTLSPFCELSRNPAPLEQKGYCRRSADQITTRTSDVLRNIQFHGSEKIMMRNWANSLLVLLMLVFCGSAQAQSQQSYPVEKRHVYSMPGQTLLDLVHSLFPKHKQNWKEITREFAALNPHAFTDSRTTLMQGTRLEIPMQLREIGFVRDLRGAAWAVNFLGNRRGLKVGDSIHVADEVLTERDAKISISAEDDAEVALRQDTTLRFVAYDYNEQGDSESVLELLRGGMRTITGRIGRGSPSRYRLVTRMATIGIRGTEYGVRLCDRGECPVSEGLSVTAAPGLYVAVLQGEIELRTRPATQTITRGGFFYVSSPDAPAQRLYEKPRLVFSPEELASLQEPGSGNALLVSAAPMAAEEPAPKVAGVFALLGFLGLALLVRARSIKHVLN